MASDFTSEFVAVPVRDHMASLWPPGWTRQKWVTGRELVWCVGSLDAPTDKITVPKGYPFNGASVPSIFTWIYPRAHPKYLQAAALHDFIYEHLGHRYTRKEADQIFEEAMIALDVHAFHARVIYLAVRAGGWPYWWRRYGHPEKKGTANAY